MYVYNCIGSNGISVWFIGTDGIVVDVLSSTFIFILSSINWNDVDDLDVLLNVKYNVIFAPNVVLPSKW